MTETRKCKKCGSTAINLDYDSILDKLDCTCDICGHSWWEEPLDSKDPLEKLGEETNDAL